jgi:hypothetical protein
MAALLELLQLRQHNDGTEPTAEEVDRWVETFPVQVLSK